MISHHKVLWAFSFPLILLLSLSAASGSFLLYRLGDIEMRPWDESLYALRAKEMYLSGCLIAPMQGGEVAWGSGKPPLGFWLILLSFHLFGIGPLALRLPFALAGVGCVLLIFLIGQEIGDRRLGLFSAASLLLMPGFLDYSRRAILEPFLTFLFLAALLLFHHSHRGSPRKSILYALASGLTIGLAILTKQVVGLVILPAFLIYEIFSWKKETSNRSLSRLFSIIAAMVASSIWWFLIMYGRYGSTFVHHYFEANVLRRLTHTITARKTMARGFHTVLLQQTDSLPLLAGLIGLLLLLLLLLRLSRQKGSLPSRPETNSLLLPFLLFSGTYYLIFGLVSRTLLSWYPFPLLPILALGQGYLLSVCVQASTGQPARGPFPFLSLLLPLLTIATALSHKLFYVSIPLVLLSLIHLALLVRGSKGRADLLPILGLLFLILYFSLGSHLALKSRTYHSPDPFPEVAKQVKDLGTEEVLFDENIGGGRWDKIHPLRFYLEIPVQKSQIEPYLRGEEDGKGKLIFTSRDRWMELRGIASGAKSVKFLPGGELITWELNG